VEGGVTAAQIYRLDLVAAAAAVPAVAMESDPEEGDALASLESSAQEILPELARTKRSAPFGVTQLESMLLPHRAATPRLDFLAGHTGHANA